MFVFAPGMYTHGEMIVWWVRSLDAVWSGRVGSDRIGSDPFACNRYVVLLGGIVRGHIQRQYIALLLLLLLLYRSAGRENVFISLPWLPAFHQSPCDLNTSL